MKAIIFKKKNVKQEVFEKLFNLLEERFKNENEFSVKENDDYKAITFNDKIFSNIVFVHPIGDLTCSAEQYASLVELELMGSLFANNLSAFIVEQLFSEEKKEERELSFLNNRDSLPDIDIDFDYQYKK